MQLFSTHIALDIIDYSTTDIRIVDGWIVASRGSNMVRVSSGKIEVSLDAGNSFLNSISFANASNILSGYLFPNGNISLFTKDNKIYKTTISLISVVEVVLKDVLRSANYGYHNPQNNIFPGAYFECEDHMSYTDDSFYIFANYCNSVAINGGRGASAVIVPFTDDNGESYALTYKFGQNTTFKDDGTPIGTGGTGNVLGNPSNPNVCRHVHTIEKNPYSDYYYMNTGDRNKTFTNPNTDEIGWYKGLYNASNRGIDWERINFGVSIEQTENLKATGMYFTPTHIYWGSDANPVTVADNQGIWRSPIDTFNDKSTHELVLPLLTEDVIINMKVNYDTGIVLATLSDASTGLTNRLLAVRDFGHGASSIHTFDDNVILLRLNDINEKGYHRLDLKGFDTLQKQTLLVKVGENLFNNS